MGGCRRCCVCAGGGGGGVLGQTAGEVRALNSQQSLISYLKHSSLGIKSKPMSYSND